MQNQVDPLGLFAPALAAPWLLEGLAYVGTAMTGILIGVGIMEAAEEEDKVEAQAEADGTAKCNKTKCPPCKTVSGRIVPIGTIGYRLDMVPPSKPHYPFKGVITIFIKLTRIQIVAYVFGVRREWLMRLTDYLLQTILW